MNAPFQPDLLETRKPENSLPLVTIELSGLGPIPSFKNRKLIRSWIDKERKKEEFRDGYWWIRKDTIKVKSMLYLEPELQEWMEKATSLIESQLRSATATIREKILMAACPRSLIATLLPLDDCWTSFREVTVRNELVEAGQEGATIQIERM